MFSRLVLAGLAGFLLVGCRSGGGFSERAKAARAGSLTYPLHITPTTLDPAMVQDVDTTDLLINVYEGLVGYNEKNEIEGVLAERWDVSPDGKTYTFHLRDCVKFQDGKLLTAEDVKWSLERALSNELVSPVATSYLGDIVGALDLNAGKAKELAGLKVIDPKTLSLTIDQPRAYFLGKLTYPCGWIVSREAGRTQIGRIGAAIGTGPFRLTEYVPEQTVTLEAFADYHRGAPLTAKVVRPIIQDPSTRLNKYRAGEIDMLTLTRPQLPFVESDAALKAQLVHQPKPQVTFVSLCPSAYPPFKDVRVRQALAHLVDRKRITQELLVGSPPAAFGLIPHHVKGYREGYVGLPFDPERAKQLLAQAGFPNGRGLPPLRMFYRSNTPDAQALVEAIATSARQVAGWEIQPTAIEWSALQDARNRRQLPTYTMSWYADYLDPENFLSNLLKSDAGQNWDAYANPEFDRITRQADRMEDSPERIALYQKAEDIAIRDVARIPVYYGRESVLTAPRVKGVLYNLFGNLPHTKVTLD